MQITIRPPRSPASSATSITIRTTYGLNLPDDNYDNTSAIFTTGLPPADPPDPVFTAGVLASITQTPLPITLSGTVYEDYNVNNVRDSGELGIPGVTLTLLHWTTARTSRPA